MSSSISKKHNHSNEKQHLVVPVTDRCFLFLQNFRFLYGTETSASSRSLSLTAEAGTGLILKEVSRLMVHKAQTLKQNFI